MSSTAASIAALASLSLLACVKPAERFDAFQERVIDAAQATSSCDDPVGTALPELPDVTGEFLLSIAVSFAPDSPLQFRCATTLRPAGAEGALDLSCTPLTVDGRTDIGDVLGKDDVLVRVDGTFCAPIVGTVPGDANPISGSDIVTSDTGLVLGGTLTSADGFCGDINGGITQPFVSDEITGTFGAVRIDTPGATGADLPDPVKECAVDVAPDAGVPDAGAPDATL